jgi:tetratricopeptide (TPR) repeat protein
MNVKYLFITISLLITSISCNAQSKNVYFSYRSSANITISLSNDLRGGEAIIAGKKYTGNVKKNQYDNHLYDFYSSNKLIFMFQPDETGIIIMNQNYEISGANEKLIELRLINQSDNMFLLYHEGYEYVLDSIPLMNDKAYYLEQAGAYKEAIHILNKIIDKKPDRVVAYLNIADAYWGISDTEEAGKSYRKYLELMKSQGKDLNRIPKRVYERIEK